MRLNQLGKKIQNSGGFPATEMSPQYSLPIPSVYCLEIWIGFHNCGWASLIFQTFNISVLLEVWNVGISCVYSSVQSMWFHKSQRCHGGHFMTAGPAKEGVTQENQTVITALCPVFSLLPVPNLLYFTVHSWMAGHHEKKQTVITALCPVFSLIVILLPNFK